MSLKDRLRLCTEFIPECGCLIWTGPLEKNGYAKVRDIGIGRNDWLHRIVWRMMRGPIPEGMMVCHTCDVRCCVNHNHMFIGTAADNARDRNTKGRQNRGEKNGMAKLTAEQVIAIRRDQRFHRDIADDYGVVFGAISKIKRRERWRHV